MPNICVQSKGHVWMIYPAWLNKGYYPTEEVESEHKFIKPTVEFFAFATSANNAKIHRHRTKLKWKNPPLITIVANHIIVK